MLDFVRRFPTVAGAALQAAGWWQPQFGSPNRWIVPVSKDDGFVKAYTLEQAWVLHMGRDLELEQELQGLQAEQKLQEPVKHISFTVDLGQQTLLSTKKI